MGPSGRGLDLDGIQPCYFKFDQRQRDADHRIQKDPIASAAKFTIFAPITDATFQCFDVEIFAFRRIDFGQVVGRV